ncbi:MAG: PIG-L deacetylase family protein [bacterium]
MKVLVLAAHPDDEVLGCGGTIARLGAEGHEITTVIFCENASVRYNNTMNGKIENMARECAKVLGVKNPVFLRMPDQKLDTYSALEMAQMVERVIKEYQPEMIFTHHGGDINEDHQVLFEATMVATRPLPLGKIKSIMTYETISSTEWGVSNYHSSFRPNVFYDISKTLPVKLQAFGSYVSEIREFPHPRSIEAIEIRAKDWGARVGVPAVEPFQLIRLLN